MSDSALGIALVGSGVGGLAASLISGRLVDRFGSRTMTALTSAGLSIALPLMGVAPSAVLVFATLVLLGSLDGLTDVSMNAQAVELQRRGGSSIISRFHALWSAGSVVGGLLASRAAQVGLELRTQLLITAVVLVGMTAVATRWLLPTTAATRNPEGRAAAPERSWPRSVLLRLLLVGVAVALAEAPPNEWAALMMADRFDLGPGAAGLGRGRRGGMLIGRLVGDDATTGTVGADSALRGRAGRRRVAVATLAPHPVVAASG